MKKGLTYVWVGSVTSKSEFIRFTEERYTKRGDFVPSIVLEAFGLKYYDVDGVECIYVKNLKKNIETFETSFIKSFRQKFIEEVSQINDSKLNAFISISDFINIVPTPSESKDFRFIQGRNFYYLGGFKCDYDP